MKKGKILPLIVGAFAYILVAMLLSGWDNRDMHLYINKGITDKFLSIFLDQSGDDKKFENYSFDLYKRKILGIGITQSSNTDRIHGELNRSMIEWVIHGGYSGDEPEGYQALRHFYDPVGKGSGGQHYLTDVSFTQGVAQWFVGGNPHIDAVEWALEDNGEISRGTDQLYQMYSWMDGKNAMKRSLEEKDKVKKDNFIATAWRCLGETLHLYADMGMPCHVRDDGHPPYLDLVGLGEGTLDWAVGIFGDPDPMEGGVRSSSQMVGSNADMTVVNDIKSKKTLREMFHAMATYTNSNYFTNQTIYGKGFLLEYRPIVRPNTPYTSPYLSESGDGWSYDEETYIFWKEINGKKVKMAKDYYFFGGPLGHRGAPYVDLECSESMAAVLIPTLTHSAPYIIERFIPKMIVEITERDQAQQSIKGIVKHETDDEYDKEIYYNGEVEIYINGAKKYTAECVSGEFEVEDAKIMDDDEIYAQIEFGGITVKSAKGDFEMRIIQNKGELSADIVETDLVFPSFAKMGENYHCEGKWAKDATVYPDAMYSIIAGFVDDESQLWELGAFSEKFYQSGAVPQRFFREDIPVPSNSTKKYMKLQITMKGSLIDQKYFLQGRIYKIPLKK